MDDDIATAEDIAAVLDHRQRCRSAWDLEEFVRIVGKFHQLLVDIGHWPLEGFSRPENGVWDNVTVRRMAGFGYSDAALSLMKRLPYVNQVVKFADEEDGDILSECRPADLRDENVLRGAREYYGCGTPLPNLICLMVQTLGDGFVLLLDLEMGAIYHKCVIDPWKSDDRTYRVQRHLDGNDGLDWYGVCDRMGLQSYKYGIAEPAIAYFQDLYDRMYHLRFLPLLPRDVYSDCDFDLGRVDDLWHRGFMRRQREAVIGLYVKHGSPDRFDRSSLLRDWEQVKAQFKEEDHAHYMEPRVPDEDEDYDDDISVDENGNRIYQPLTDSESGEESDEEEEQDEVQETEDARVGT